MTDRDVVERVSKLWKGRLWGPFSRKDRGPNYKPIYTTAISGPKAAAIMFSILPYMGIRRTNKIIEILDYWFSFDTPKKGRPKLSENKAPLEQKTKPSRKAPVRRKPRATSKTATATTCGDTTCPNGESFQPAGH